MEYLKCVVLGPPVSGKTSLINTFMSGEYCGYIPHNVITRYDVNFVVAGEEFSRNFFFKIYDYDIFKSNAQQFLKDEELNSIDVIILCFKNISVHRELLLTHFKALLSKKWSKVPILLVSSFSDLMNKCSWMEELLDDDSSTNLNFIKEFGAAGHISCSSLENTNINEVFAKAFKLAINKPNEITTVEEIKRIEMPTTELLVESSNLNEDFDSKRSVVQEKVILIKTIEKINSQTISITRLIIPLGFACALLFYLFTNRYCKTNQTHCSEIYELGMEVYEESISHLKEIYQNFHKHYHKINFNN